jgi:hypothetical protein
MCTVCAIYDYGRNQPNDFWTQESYRQFLALLEAAKQFDQKTNQPDCEDPAKGRWLQEVKASVEEKQSD